MQLIEESSSLSISLVIVFSSNENNRKFVTENGYDLIIHNAVFISVIKSI